MHIPPKHTLSGSGKAIRLITLSNFVIFVLFVVPPAHHCIDRAFVGLRAVHLEDPVGWSLQIWLVGSTLVATALLGRMLWQKRRTTPSGGAISVRED